LLLLSLVLFFVLLLTKEGQYFCRDGLLVLRLH
jgi:hypothetical protein